jgi:hypothetical protein
VRVEQHGGADIGRQLAQIGEREVGREGRRHGRPRE